MSHTDLIINGKPVDWPSVTSVTGILKKEFLERWRGKIGNEEADRISRESAAVGTEVHELIERYLVDGGVNTCDYSDKVRGLFKSWWTWWSSQSFKAVANEIKVISKKKKFHGTFDCVLEVPGIPGKILVDWKISKSDDHFRYLQLAGYAFAYHEQYKEKILEGLIVRVHPETGKIHLTEIKDLWTYVPIFLALRKIYDFVKKGKIKKRGI